MRDHHSKDPEKLALIDMDNTIANYNEALHRELEKLASPTDPPLPDNPHDGPDWVNTRIDLIHQKAGFWTKLTPLELGMTVVQVLEGLGYGLHVLTNGPYFATSAWTEKRDWCHLHLPLGTPVTITEDKGIVFGDVLFDDYPPYVERWLKKNTNGKALMLDWHFNRYFEHPQVLRISNQEDVNSIPEWLNQSSSPK